MKKVSLIALFDIFFLLVLITGCSGLVGQDSLGSKVSASTPISSLQPIDTFFLPTATMVMPSLTPTFPSLDVMTIDVTQGPVLISTVKPLENEYLYKEAHVTFKMGTRWSGTVFLNLDDISNNDRQNSDILIYIDTGSIGTTFDIFPTNYARYYFSGKAAMDYSSCVANFPKTPAEQAAVYGSIPPVDMMVESGNAYCVLTNEGRLAVVNMLVDSVKPDDLGELNLSLVVTVYNKIESELFTPAPTQTLGPLPTPTNRYSKRGISDPNQVQVLDDSIQAFIDAINSGDKVAISRMLTYPMTIILVDNWEDIQVISPDDFINNFDKIFPEEYATKFAKTTLVKNVRVYPGEIALECNGGVIFFSPDGKINTIDIYQNNNWY